MSYVVDLPSYKVSALMNLLVSVVSKAPLSTVINNIEKILKDKDYKRIS